MKRGELWTVSGAPDYSGKPRPAVIVQDDRFDATASITVCILTSRAVDAPIFRIAVDPDAGNGLRKTSYLMVDKITTIPKSRIGSRVGRLADEDIVRFNRAAMVFLGLAASARSKID